MNKLIEFLYGAGYVVCIAICISIALYVTLVIVDSATGVGL